jgi:membrane-associated phospholipid phosphatase
VARGKRYRTDSFPSGHTTGITSLAIAGALALWRQRMISPAAAASIAVGAPVVMGAYRVLADDHWATDVAGGWLVGGAVALMCDALLAGAVGGAAHHAGHARGGATARGRRRRSRRRPGRSERSSSAA